MYTQAEQISQKSEGLWTQWRRKLKVTASQPCLSVVFTPAPPNSTNSWIIVFFCFFCSSFLQEACWRHLQHHLICRTSLCILSPFPISHPVLRTVSAMIQNKIKRQEPPLPSQNNDPPLPHSPPMTLSHPFVSAAQNEADSGDASPVDQWAPVVKGCVLSLASLKRQSEIFVRREGEGRVEPVGVGGGGTWHPTRSQPVTGHHIRRRAGMRTF